MFSKRSQVGLLAPNRKVSNGWCLPGTKGVLRDDSTGQVLDWTS